MRDQKSITVRNPLQSKLIYILTFMTVMVLILNGCEIVESESDLESIDVLEKGKPKFTVELLGENEVNSGGGDPDGYGTAKLTLRQKQGTIEYEITVTDIATATAAHIHNAPAGNNGTVVVNFTPPDVNGVSVGTVTGVDPLLIKEIRANPSNYYVNVHNSEYPAGAVRGQLK